MDVLDFLDDAAKAAALESYWKKLQESPDGCIDLDTLRVCIRLLPPAAKVSNRLVLPGVREDTTGQSKGKSNF
jgi:hypothetical protein